MNYLTILNIFANCCEHKNAPLDDPLQLQLPKDVQVEMRQNNASSSRTFKKQKLLAVESDGQATEENTQGCLGTNFARDTTILLGTLRWSRLEAMQATATPRSPLNFVWKR
ncbi:hypothetical protein H2198_003483 [Neophaeococcomyces mojaviensis]|uniref:Uncharacterized protein n=1 Tax=Neophaeococcomyces mojaviensis TaxID=3383035 RepID=A0ACC3ABI9_9EURO|nr:hypothetical protein H2198_003483 [Knufia sp. JES_112]